MLAVDVALHVTCFGAYSYARLVLGTLVLGDFVSTHPRDEGVGRRYRGFIGMSVGSFVGTKGRLDLCEILEEVRVGGVVGVSVGVRMGSSW